MPAKLYKYRGFSVRGVRALTEAEIAPEPRLEQSLGQPRQEPPAIRARLPMAIRSTPPFGSGWS